MASYHFTYFMHVPVHVGEMITGGTTNINLKLDDSSLVDDFCETLDFIGLTCPVKKTTDGQFDIKQTIPDIAPQVKFEKSNALL